MKPEFWRNIKEVAKSIAAEDNFLVVGHHDADGITACAITLDLLRWLGKETEFRIMKQLDSNLIGDILDSNKTVVFTDMGSGQLSIIQNSGLSNFYIIDHHPPEATYEKQINPHFYGYDGGLEISGAGLAYFAAKSLNREEMAHLAIVGAVGDMQDSKGKLHSLNRILLEDGQRLGTIKVKHDLRLFGRQSRPLVNMLRYASDPFLPGLTGDFDACKAFIEGLEIKLERNNGEWKSYVDLSPKERKNLMSALYMHLLNFGIPEHIIQGMVGEVYTLLKEEKRTELRDAKEFATVMNACGRQEEPETGLKVCLGDREEAWTHAKSILQKHRRTLRQGLEFLSTLKVQELTNLYYFDSEGKIDENIIGVIAGMAYGARIIRANKPILALAKDKDIQGMLKISARTTWNLVRRGIHLGNAMRDGSSLLGGEGGGHDIAAGARIPEDRKEEFLQWVDRKFGEQLG